MREQETLLRALDLWRKAAEEVDELDRVEKALAEPRIMWSLAEVDQLRDRIARGEIR